SRPGGGVRLASAPAGNDLPYTIYYGNLHSQTNHSDGGTPVEHCEESEKPQAGELGPTDAYEMMRTEAEGDFLLTSEHNHLYDGSTRINAAAEPSDAIALFRSGVRAASEYRIAHPTFMALYGLEWGVTTNGGGHINLINANVLANWERNEAGQLIGSVETPRDDYPALYETMKERGWIGQFNHPDRDQFLVDGEGMGFDENGADVMVLVEVLNTSAFSSNTSQTEPKRRDFVGAWKRLLERGYKLAPASNQDNHCANWGLSSTNRTGVLLAEDAAFTRTNFLNALRARRVFATEDKTGQLVLTANGHVMGRSFSNHGKLTLKANYASTDGHTAQRVQFFEGVPGRNGEVTRLAGNKGTLTITPEAGEHFYYAVVTQEDGLRLWSAPVWVTQE
ncbi:MAG TPA: CehA/McbA family metallohydrolase, partial [Lysobacter sp.]